MAGYHNRTTGWYSCDIQGLWKCLGSHNVFVFINSLQVILIILPLRFIRLTWSFYNILHKKTDRFYSMSSVVFLLLLFFSAMRMLHFSSFCPPPSSGPFQLAPSLPSLSYLTLSLSFSFCHFQVATWSLQTLW